MQRRTAAVTTVSLFLLLLIGLYQLASSRQYQLFGELIARVETEQPLIALTFDDGPSERYTAEVVELLARYQVAATFFVTGHELARHPEQGRLLVQAGHQLGNHSYTHKRMLLVSPATVASEVERTDQQIRQAGFTDKILFRPPYGKKLFTLPWYLSQQQRKTIMWDLEPESEPKLAADPQAMAAAVIAKARPGSIILLHVMYQSRQSSREALPLIIEGLQAKGFRFVTVNELLQSHDQE